MVLKSLKKILTTAFAPAERSSAAEVKADLRLFKKDPHVVMLLDSIPDMAVILNKNRQIVFANKMLLQHLGKTEVEEIIGVRPGELMNCIHSCETSGGCGTSKFCEVCGAVNAIIASQNSQIKSVNECEIVVKDAYNLNFRVWASPLIKNGEQYTLFVLRDIADEKYRNSLEHIFFHDLTNTGAGIYSLLSLIEENPDSYREYADVLSRLSVQLLEEISVHRDIIDAEKGHIAIMHESIDASGLLEKMIDVYSKHPVAKGKIIKIATDSEKLVFLSDKRLVKRVIGNMLKNALEASSTGTTITIACRKQSGMVVFSIHNPSYIEKDIQLKIFKRSFSTKGSGRGWGTYSMKLLTENYLFGKVSFTSEPDSGTTFYVEYPLAKTE